MCLPQSQSFELENAYRLLDFHATIPLLHPAVAATQTYARITFVVPNEILSGYPTVALVGERGYILPSLGITRITVPLASAELPPSTNDVVPSLFTNHSICVPHDEQEAVEHASTDMITTQVAINDLESLIKQEPISLPSDEQQAAGPATSAGAEATQVPEIIDDDAPLPTQDDHDADAPAMGDVGNHDATAPQPATGCGVHLCNSQLSPCARREIFFVKSGGKVTAYRVVSSTLSARTMILSDDEVKDVEACELNTHYFDEHDGTARVACGTCKKDPRHVCLFCLPKDVKPHHYCKDDAPDDKPVGTVYQRGAGDKKGNLERHLMAKHCKDYHYICVICGEQGTSRTKGDAKDHFTSCHRPVTVNGRRDYREWTIVFQNADRVYFPEGTQLERGRQYLHWPERRSLARNGESKSNGGPSELPRGQARSKRTRKASVKGKERAEDVEEEEDYGSSAFNDGVLSTYGNSGGQVDSPSQRTRSKNARNVSVKGKERAEDFDEEDYGASAAMELDQQRDAAKKRRGGKSLSGSPAKKRKTGDEPWDDDEYLFFESEATPFAPSSSSDFSLSSTEDQDQPDWRGFDIEEFLASWSPHSDGVPSSNYLPDISMQEAEFFALQQALMNGNGNQGNTAGSQDTAGRQETAGSQETAGALDSTGSLDTAFLALSPPKPDRPAATHTSESPRRSARHRRNGSGSGGSPFPTPSIIPGLGLLARFGANK